MNTKLIPCIHALVIALLTLTGCEGDSPESEVSEQDLTELPDGVRHATVDGVDSWRLDGLEAHEWFRDQLIERANNEADPARSALTWELIEIIEDDLDTLQADGDTDNDQFRASSVNASLAPLISGSNRGWTASATASKSGLPANLDVQTKVQVGITVAENNNSKWGTGTLSKSSTASAISPGSCYARAFARSASSSVLQETFACP